MIRPVCPSAASPRCRGSSPQRDHGFRPGSDTRTGSDSATSRLRPPLPPADRAQPHQPADDDVDRRGISSYFRLTHRFARDLRRGDFGDLAEDLFSLDNGAIIGLEYRFGITSNLQAGVHRSTVEQDDPDFGAMGCPRGRETRCRSRSRCSVRYEGLNNLHQDYQPGDCRHRLAHVRRPAGAVCDADLRCAHHTRSTSSLATKDTTTTSAGRG